MSKIHTLMEIFQEFLLEPVSQNTLDALKVAGATYERSVTITMPSGLQMTYTEKELRDMISMSTAPWIPVGAQRPEVEVQTND